MTILYGPCLELPRYRALICSSGYFHKVLLLKSQPFTAFLLRSPLLRVGRWYIRLTPRRLFPPPGLSHNSWGEMAEIGFRVSPGVSHSLLPLWHQLWQSFSDTELSPISG